MNWIAGKSISRRTVLLGACAAGAAVAEPRDAFFLPNRGQFSEGGAYCADLPRWRGSFAAGRAHFRAKRLVGDPGPHGVSAGRRPAAVDLSLTLVGSVAVDPVGEDQRAGRSDFFFHGDPKTFVRNLPHYYRLRYREIWPGVDLLVRVWERGAELTPVVSDAAQAERIAFAWRGGTPQRQGGAVSLGAPWGSVRQSPPVAQSGRRLSGAYRRDSQGAVRFVLG